MAFGFNCAECAVRMYTILFIEASYTIIRFSGYYSPSAVKVRGACLVLPRCDEALIYSTIGKLCKYYKETLEQPPHCCGNQPLIGLSCWGTVGGGDNPMGFSTKICT